jgi:hypothetical protein
MQERTISKSMIIRCAFSLCFVYLLSWILPFSIFKHRDYDAEITKHMLILNKLSNHLLIKSNDKKHNAGDLEQDNCNELSNHILNDPYPVAANQGVKLIVDPLNNCINDQNNLMDANQNNYNSLIDPETGCINSNPDDHIHDSMDCSKNNSKEQMKELSNDHLSKDHLSKDHLSKDHLSKNLSKNLSKDHLSKDLSMDEMIYTLKIKNIGTHVPDPESYSESEIYVNTNTKIFYIKTINGFKTFPLNKKSIIKCEKF